MLGTSDSLGSIVINEVVTSNVVSLIHEQLGSPDWIELYNPSDADVDLSACYLTDNIRNPHKWSFPAITIKANGYLLVYAEKTDIITNEPVTGFGLSRSGDNLYLIDRYTNILSEVAIPSLSSDVSYARRDDSTYGYCGSPTPGSKNSDEIVSSTEAIRYSANAQALLLSEVMPNNDSAYAASDGNYYPWAELYNASDSPLMLSHYYISDSPEELTKQRLPEYTLGAGEYAIIWFGGEDAVLGGICADFMLGSYDDTLFLSYDNGYKSSKITWSLGLAANISVLTDGSLTAYPTPNAKNSNKTFMASSVTYDLSLLDVYMNEVLPNNKFSICDSYGDRSDYVELYNKSDNEISLASYCITDDAKTPAKWQFPADAKLAPHEYMLVFLSGSPNTSSEYHASFSLSPGETLMLINLDGLVAQTIDIPQDIGENISIGLNKNSELKYYATPTPYAENTTHAFERSELAVIFDPSSVYISEVSAASRAKSGEGDWIELYNGGASSIDLSGWKVCLSGNSSPTFTVKNLSISAGGYAVIDASKLNNDDGISFYVSASGDTVLLADENGENRDIFLSGVLKSTVSSGRVEGRAQRVFFNTKTKNKPNASPLSSYASSPVFSCDTLYHSDAFMLTITSATRGANIYYTLNGGMPSESSERYSSPIKISKTTVVRAIAVYDGMLDSAITTRTYIFDNTHTVPVVCLSIGSSDLNTVYSVTNRWKKIEREGGFAFYEPDGTLGVESACGLRVSGASSLTYSQKSFTVYFRGAYGRSRVAYPFYTDSDVNVFSSLVLRNSGQDSFAARLRDSYFMKAVKGLNLDHVETRPVVVYINGTYYGIYDLNENQNEDYLANHYGISADTVNIVRRNETRLEGDKYDFLRVREYARNHNMSNKEYYDELCQWVDVDYFTDYLIAQTYFTNSDMFNQKYWATSDYSIKWRPIYYDLDYALNDGNYTRNIFGAYFTRAGIASNDGSITNMDIFCALRQSPIWCEKFCKRYVYVVLNHFTTERLLSIFDDCVNTLKPEMPAHIQRWHDISSLERWESHLSTLRNALTKRSEYALSGLKREFSLTDSQMEDYKSSALQSPIY